MPLGAFHLLQLQQKRGRLPDKKKRLHQEHALTALFQEAARFTIEESYLHLRYDAHISTAAELDIEAYLEHPPPREHHPYPLIMLKPILPQITILFDASASLDAEQRYLAFVMLCVLTHHFPQSLILAFSTHTHVIKTAIQHLPFADIFEAIQNIPPEYTHLKEAFDHAIRHQHPPHNIMILLSDGASNYGPPPTDTDLQDNIVLFLALCAHTPHETYRFVQQHHIIPLYNKDMMAIACMRIEDYIKDSLS